MEFKDKVIILTGAAGGIGSVTAQLFSQKGATVVLVDLDQSVLNKKVIEIKNEGGQAVGIAIDASDENSVKSAVASTLKQFGKIDVLVNGVGICKTIPILDIEVKEWDRFMAINLRSVFLFSKEVFRHMLERNYGKIINVASAAAKIGGVAAGAHYSASKAGVICFTKSLALQAAPYKINVNAVCPGPTKTEMTDVWGQNVNNKFAEAIPFKEYAEPIDIAESIIFLSSDKAKYITGEILDVNGGLVMD